jgi:hypothetical protein
VKVCSLSCRVMLLLAQPLSTPLQNGLRFFHTPIPAIPSACLTACFPLDEGNYGLTTFRFCDHNRLGLSSPPTVLFAHGRKASTSCTHCFAFWLKPGTYAFSLVLITAFIRHSRLLTILPNSSPLPSAFSGSALASQFVRWLSPKVHCWWSFARRDCFFPTST